ncbi:hypothetical protein V6N13_037351 [Hibiscus sabdariffa]
MVVTGNRSAWYPSGAWHPVSPYSWPPPSVVQAVRVIVTMVRIRLHYGFSDGHQTSLLVHCLSPLAVLGFSLLWSFFSVSCTPWIGCALPCPLALIIGLSLACCAGTIPEPLSALPRPLWLLLLRPVWPLRGPARPFMSILDRPSVPYALQPHTLVRASTTWSVAALYTPTVCLFYPYGVASRWHAVRTLSGSLQSPSLEPVRASLPLVGSLCPGVRSTHTPVCDLRTPLYAWPASASTDLCRPIPGLCYVICGSLYAWSSLMSTSSIVNDSTVGNGLATLETGTMPAPTASASTDPPSSLVPIS